MHASIRKYRAIDIDALVSRVQDEFVGRVGNVEGFVGYYVIDGGDGTVTSVTLGETQEAVEQSNEIARDWVIERAAHLVGNAPEMTTGEIRVHVER